MLENRGPLTPDSLLTHFQRPDRITEPLYVCTVIFNAQRYRTRWKLYQDFSRMVAQAGAVLYTVEVAFGDREFSVTQACDEHDLQLRTSHEVWYKEQVLNLLVQRVIAQNPAAKYIAVVDADVAFARSDWANETKHALQHHSVVQMWSHAYDLGPKYEPVQKHLSLAHCMHLRNPVEMSNGYYCVPAKRLTYWHPGYGWAFRRDTFDSIGGLLDFAILGSADAHMGYAFIGEIERTIHPGLTTPYKEKLRRWGIRADVAVNRNVGIVPGLLLHYHHGPKRKRGYVSRWRILIEERFTPDTDIFRDGQGLWQLTKAKPKLRDRIRAYFLSRDEDDIRVE